MSEAAAKRPRSPVEVDENEAPSSEVPRVTLGELDPKAVTANLEEARVEAAVARAQQESALRLVV
jgi:hypothetical protein